MAGKRQGEAERRATGLRFVTAFLQALGVMNLVVTVVGALAVLTVQFQRGEPVSTTFIAAFLTSVAAGLTFGGLLLAVATWVRHGTTLSRSLNRFTGQQAKPARGSTYHTEVGDEDLDRAIGDQPGILDRDVAREVLALLGEIRDFTAATPDERVKMQGRLRANLQRRAAEEIVDAVNARQVGRARVLLQDAEAAYGDSTTLERLGARIDQAAARNEPLDYVRAKRLVEEAIAEGEWESAERYAHALHFDHPDSTRCRQLWEGTRRARLYTHIQQRADEHHWAEALAAGEEFIERFPDSTEADALRAQLDTLRRNVEIVQRKQFEARFKELLGGQQYAEALRVARHVVEQFPESPQAVALRPQIPLLERYADSG